MLKGIHPAISPELLKILAEMGHGDEIVLSDAHFPARSLLKGIAPLFEFDAYVDAPLIMMQVVPGDTLDPQVEENYLTAIKNAIGFTPNLERIERFAFYERAKQAYAVVISGETAKYGNIIIKKGVTPVL